MNHEDHTHDYRRRIAEARLHSPNSSTLAKVGTKQQCQQGCGYVFLWPLCFSECPRCERWNTDHFWTLSLILPEPRPVAAQG